MSLQNSPVIHQQQMTAALHDLLGKICHIYLDNIVIWSSDIAEHMKHIVMVMKALWKAHLYCNLDKCQFYLKKLDFLRHHISTRGIEPNLSKVEHVLNWPVPKSATDVRTFLGLVRYIFTFLPQLADHTVILTLLTMKEAKKSFPEWDTAHQTTFDAIKALIVSVDCWTTIDHDTPCDNKIFITCDASDWHTGTTLSFGPTWELVQPVAFDSMQL